MGRSIFNISIGKEEFVKPTVPKPIIKTISLEELNNMDMVEEEVREINLDLQPKVDNLEQHIDAVTQLQEQTSVQDEVLANDPHSITEDTVTLAQENMCIVLGRLGLNIDEYNDIYRKNYRLKIASENRANVIDKLRISNEGIKEVINNIIDKIKKAFKALGDMFKKLMVKISTALENISKKASDLLAKVDSADINKNLTDENKEKISNYWKYVQILESVSDPFDFDKVDKAIQGSVYALENVARRAKDPNFKLSEGFTKPDIKAKQDYLDEKYTETCALRFFGKCKVIGCKENTFAVVNVKTESIPDLKNINIDKNKLKKGLELAKKNGEKTKDFINKADSIRKASDAVLGAIEKKSADKLTDTDKTILSFVGKLGSVITLDLINNYRDFNRTIVQTANLLINSKEDKDEKKEEEKDKKEEKKDDKEEEKKE